MKPTAYIFGGQGFIGGHYFSHLSSLGVNCEMYDLVASSSVKSIDIRNEISIDTDFQADDIIINLAAVHKTPGHPDFDYFETNIKGAENVCTFAEKVGINKIIFTSSIAPYGASEDAKTEETLTTPNTPYGISKLTAEYIHKEWAVKDASRRLMILRPGVVFGEGENGNFTRLAKAINKGIFFFPGRKDTIKACIYVKELVYQSWELFQKQSDQVAIYNFAYAPAYTIQQIANCISKVIGKKVPKILVPSFLLMPIAHVFKFLGLGKLGIHPDRVKKLMISTNIDGSKLRQHIKDFKYSLETAIDDWYKDCDGKGLY